MTTARANSCDPDHDFLPRRVTGTLHDLTVTKFAQDDGRWFPVEGLVTYNQPRPKARTGAFVVTGLKINRPIPDSRFEMPPDRDDVRVLDMTSDRHGFRPVEH